MRQAMPQDPTKPSPVERHVIAQIERRRSHLPPVPERALGASLDRLVSDLRASVRRETTVQSAWRRLAPADLAGTVRAVSWRSGVLRLAADDQSARYLADRWLRGQGKTLLAAALGGAITRTIIRVGSAPSPEAPARRQKRRPRP